MFPEYENAADNKRYAYVGVGRDDGAEAGEYSAIVYDSTRLAVVSSGTFWYADDPERAGSIAWGANLPRICTWARFRLLVPPDLRLPAAHPAG